VCKYTYLYIYIHVYIYIYIERERERYMTLTGAILSDIISDYMTYFLDKYSLRESALKDLAPQTCLKPPYTGTLSPHTLVP
jgi:hypothetical protein